MNIRPIDLQVMIPRTTDVAKIASVIDQNPATQQQQLALQAKQVATQRQQQVKTALQKNHAGSVTTEDLEQQKEKERHGGRREAESSSEEERASDVAAKNSHGPTDPVRGRTIDIKT